MRAATVTVLLSLSVVAATATVAARLHAAADTLRAEQRRLHTLALTLHQQERDCQRRRAELETEQEAQIKLSATLGSQRSASFREFMNRGLAELNRVGRPVPLQAAALPLRQSKAGKIYFSELLDRPDYAAAAATVERVHIASTYAPLIASLGFSSDDRKRLIDLLLDREMARQDLVALDRTADSTTMNQHKVDVIREWRTRVQTAFGREVPGQIYDFDGTILLRAAVNQLAARVSYTETPLSTHQADAVLAGLIATVGKQVRSHYWVIPDDAIARLKSVLSSGQISALTQIQEEQRATIEARDARAGEPRSP